MECISLTICTYSNKYKVLIAGAAKITNALQKDLPEEEDNLEIDVELAKEVDSPEPDVKPIKKEDSPGDDAESTEDEVLDDVSTED